MDQNVQNPAHEERPNPNYEDADSHSPDFRVGVVLHQCGAPRLRDRKGSSKSLPECEIPVGKASLFLARTLSMPVKSSLADSLAVTVGVCLAAGVVTSVLLFPGVSQTHFSARLTEVGSGELVNENGSAIYVNLSLAFASPSVLDPAGVDFYLVGPSGNLPLDNNSTISKAVVSYCACTTPHWLLTVPGPNGPGLFRALSAEVTNPDRNVVGPVDAGSLGSWFFPPHGDDRTVDSGAIIMLLFPIGDSPSGYTVGVGYSSSTETTSVVLR